MTAHGTTTLGEAHTPLRHAVTDAIRDRIIDGRYAPGSRLYEETVATELGVSRNPIREAFQVLAAEGFVALEPRRGASVASVDARHAADLFEVRRALEGLMAELAATKRTDEAVAELRAIVAEGQEAGDARELARLPQLNTRFHDQLAAMAGNRFLATMLSQVSGIVRWIYAERIQERVLGSWHEHTLICEAVADGDADRARQLAMDHVDSARRAYFADNG